MVDTKTHKILYIRRVLEEYMRYLHNPHHYPDIEAIQNFLGDTSSGGGFECLKHSYL